MDENKLVVGGLVPFTTIDFPNRLAAVVFCQGCSWRCSYCHNQHLLPLKNENKYVWHAVLDWLKTRKGLLDGVVFSGGEPLLQKGLPSALSDVKDLGFATALHTAGVHTKRLATVLPLLDWIGFDIKAPFDDYRRITGVNNSGHTAKESLQQVISSGVKYEIRCTVPPELSTEDITHMRMDLNNLGISELKLQKCRTQSETEIKYYK